MLNKDNKSLSVVNGCVYWIFVDYGIMLLI